MKVVERVSTEAFPLFFGLKNHWLGAVGSVLQSFRGILLKCTHEIDLLYSLVQRHSQNN